MMKPFVLDASTVIAFLLLEGCANADAVFHKHHDLIKAAKALKVARL